MNPWRYVARRIVWTLAAAYGLLSATFLVFGYAPDPNQFKLGPGLTELYRKRRNYGEPVLERYVDWMVGYLTLDWGKSIDGEPIAGLVAEGLLVTLTYLVPAITLAVVVGIGAGLVAAALRGGLFDRACRAIAYAGFGLPAFVAAELLFFAAVEHLGWFAVRYDPEYGTWTARNLPTLVLPGLVVTANVLAVQFRYARIESLEYLSRDFVRTLRANGAGPAAVLRHVARNASLPLLSLFFVELLTVLYITVFVVEVVFGIPGFGKLAYEGIRRRDIGVILGTTTIPVLVALLGNLIQDVAYVLLDPRIEYGERE